MRETMAPNPVPALNEAMATGDTTKLTKWLEEHDGMVVVEASEGETVDHPDSEVTEV